MPCQPVARTPKPLSQCLEQDSRAVKPLHTLRHTTQKMQSRLKSLLRGKRPHVCFLGLSCKPLRGDPQIIRWDCRRCCVRLVTWEKYRKTNRKTCPQCLIHLIGLISSCYIIQLSYFPFSLCKENTPLQSWLNQRPLGPGPRRVGSRSCSASTFQSPHLMKNSTFSVAFPLRTLSGELSCVTL